MPGARETCCRCCAPVPPQPPPLVETQAVVEAEPPGSLGAVKTALVEAVTSGQLALQLRSRGERAAVLWSSSS